MNQCTQLTDEAVEAVVQFCPCMDIFIFSGCPKMTGKSNHTQFVCPVMDIGNHYNLVSSANEQHGLVSGAL